jgi:hypothetical protein
MTTSAICRLLGRSEMRPQRSATFQQELGTWRQRLCDTGVAPQENGVRDRLIDPFGHQSDDGEVARFKGCVATTNAFGSGGATAALRATRLLDD